MDSASATPVTSRREFLATLLGSSALALAGIPACARGGASASSGSLDRIGVQLYTVRDMMERDMARTLAEVARIGYQEVEFAGYFGQSANDVRRMLADNGLSAPASHVPYERIAGDWPRALDEAATAGHQWVVIPWLPESARTSVDAYRRVAAQFNEAASAARAAGLRFAYHNHEFEFARIDGTVPFDVLLTETDPELVEFELDVYWITHAGHDPLAYINAEPARISLLHLKESAGAPDHRMTDVGAGVIDWAAVLSRGAATGVRHCFVEHDNPGDAIASISASYAYLRALEF